jgi:hypothetical protein
MNTSKTIFPYLRYLLVFLLAGVACCAIRAKYRCLPMVRAGLAPAYVAFFRDYSFLQYRQAGGEQGETALLGYLGILQKIRDEGIDYPQNSLRFDSGLTYLRLYRLELAAGNTPQASEYLKSAQKELTRLGWKDVSTETLIKNISAREAGEAKLYNSDKDIPIPSGAEALEPLKDSQ